MSKVIIVHGRLYCDEPDHDMIGRNPIKCDYPIPCPYHTAVVEVDADSPDLAEITKIADEKRRAR